MKKIAILTSGGDAPGMNACIRSVVRNAIYRGMEVMGVKRGYYGLVNNEMEPMNMGSVSDIIQRGGTILYTARCQEFKTEEGIQKAIRNMKENGIEGLVVIGGDGSFRGAKDITERCGIPTIGIPGTIDNDLAYTDYTLGFDTACNTVVTLINYIRDTMTSHERVSVIEVMGRNCGDIALYSGIAGGAESIVIPEVPMTAQDIVDRIHQSRARGKRSNIIVVAEGAGDSNKIAEAIEQETGFEARATILGHVQRGGTTTQRDRVMAGLMGYRAVLLLKNDEVGRVVAVRNGSVVDYEIDEALSMKRVFDLDMYKTACRLSI